MKKILLPIFCMLSIWAFAQTNQVQFVFDHQVNGESLQLNNTEFSIWNSKNVMLERAEFYISEITLIAQDDSETTLDDVHLLVNVAKGDIPYPVGNWDISAVKGVKLYVGVDPDHNHLDPSSYPQSHPLAPQNPSMHWGWTAGYRFMAIEGKVDNNSDGTPESIFQFHNLGDNLYYESSMTGLAVEESGVLTINVTLDFTKLFNDMTMTGNLIHHGSDNDNKQMLENAAFSGFFTMDGANNSIDLIKNAHLMKVGPNPASEFTSLNYDFSAFGSEISISVSNTFGQTLLTINELPSSGTYELDVNDLSAGMYQISVISGGQMVAVKRLQVTH